MPRYLTILIVALFAMTGCGREAPPPAAGRSQSSAATPSAVSAPAVEGENIASGSPDASSGPPNNSAQTESTSGEPLAAESTQASATKSEGEQPPEAPAERIAILTPGGPLLVDVRLTIDGRPHTEAFDALVKQVFDAGDTDGDGRPTWKEFAANQEYLKGEMPNMPAAGSRQMKILVERYDENRDGKIQRSEATSWLGRDAGTSASAFAVRSSRSYLPIPRANSQVWPLLDADKNGRLSGDEIRGAADKLLSLDANDDRVIALPELASLREQLAAAGGQRTAVSREATRYAAIHLEPNIEIDRLHYLLGDLYAPRQDLGPDSFSELAGLFRKLDANDDEWLDQDELAEILTVDPHLELEVAFSPTASRAAIVHVRQQAPELTLLAQPSADRVVFALGNTRLVVSAHDLTPTQNSDENSGPAAGAAATRAGIQVRLMVHDQGDALFEDLDANADGQLGEREIASCPERLLGRDANGDGQLANDELPYSMIVAFLLGERPAEQSFYVPASATIPTSDGELPSWFAHADLNGDGDVGRREFVGSAQRFNGLDANHDGYISGEEASAIPVE